MLILPKSLLLWRKIQIFLGYFSVFQLSSCGSGFVSTLVVARVCPEFAWHWPGTYANNQKGDCWLEHIRPWWHEQVASNAWNLASYSSSCMSSPRFRSSLSHQSTAWAYEKNGMRIFFSGTQRSVLVHSVSCLISISYLGHLRVRSSWALCCVGIYGTWAIAQCICSSNSHIP